MWTAENRPRYNHDRLRYPSDLTDDEWALVEPEIAPGKRGGGKRRVNLREVVNGIMYILSTDCQWRYLLKDLPPRSTVDDYFSLWTRDGTLDRIHHVLYVKYREKAERDATPTACIIDSQSVKCAEKGGPCIDPPGFDAGTLIKGKKRHVLVNTQGLLLHGIVTAADLQDRDGGLALPAMLFGLFPYFEKLFADSAYEGPVFRVALTRILPHLKPEIVKRSDRIKGFVVLPKRWIAERTIAWLNRCRRFATAWENLNHTASAFLKLASIRLMPPKLCSPC